MKKIYAVLAFMVSVLSSPVFAEVERDDDLVVFSEFVYGLIQGDSDGEVFSYQGISIKKFNGGFWIMGCSYTLKSPFTENAGVHVQMANVIDDLAEKQKALCRSTFPTRMAISILGFRDSARMDSTTRSQPDKDVFY